MFKIIPVQYRILIAVALLLALVWVSYQQGWQHAVDHVAAEQAKVKKRAEKQQVKQASAVQAAVVQNATAIESTRVVYRTINKEVIKYAQAQSTPAASAVQAAACTDRLDGDWVRIHDAAAQPDSAASALASTAEPVGEASKAETLGVVTRNYESCELWRNQVMGWQAWWGSQNAEPL
jgi:hypothetical protein